MAEWFRRAGDIPGFAYQAPILVDRDSLAGCDDIPEVQALFGDQKEETLSWPTGDGSRGGSASPVHYRAFSAVPDYQTASIAAIVQNVYEGLELPGEPPDYHFLIQGSAEVLWRRHRKEPAAAEHVERLCWLDVDLILAHPNAASEIVDGIRRYFGITSLLHLIELYEDRGEFATALKAAEIASRFGQCEDARERLRWKTGARDTEPIPEPVKVPPQHPNGARPTIHPWSEGRISDWAFRSQEGDGPFAGSWFHQYNWWDDWCQRRFDSLWTNHADHVADDLADEYWFYWPWLIGKALITSSPDTYERILDFARDEHRPGPAHLELNPHAVSDQIATIGAFHVVRRRRTWREPSGAICPTCGQEYWNGDIRPWAIQAFGPVRYCMDCCFQVRNGDPRPTWSQEEVKAALRNLQDAFEAIPAQNFSAGRVPHDGPDEQRDQLISALMAMPPVNTVKRVLGQKDWLGTLKAAGLVGDTWRPSLGTWCHATDGHRCRSLLEKAIDDWFTTNGIPHECEPRWPRHPEFNPSGAKRADWLLNDGTYVECAGMLQNKDYAEKIALKQQLAQQLLLPLVVIGPTDMHRLSQIFAGYVIHRS